MRPVSGGFRGHPEAGRTSRIQDDAPCQHHPLGIWQGHGGPGDCCCSSSGSPPRSWPPWWPRPPCCPSPNRHAAYPASRCRRCQPSQHRRPRRPPPPLPGSRPPRLPLPPLRTLGGEPSADRPRPPDRPRPKRRPQSVARQPPRRPRPWRHHPAHRDRATDHGRAHHHRAIDHSSVDDHAGDHDQHRAHHHRADQTGPRRPRPGRPTRPPTGADHDWAGNDHDRTSDPARQPTSKRLGRDRRCAPAHPGSAVPAARAGSTSRRDTRQAAPRQPPPPPRLIRPGARPATNPGVAFLELGQPRVHPLGRQPMAAQDQRGDVQALCRLSEKPRTQKRGHGRAPPRRARRIGCQRPERKAREQGLTTPGGNSLS